MGVTVNPISGGGGLSAPINAVDIADGSVSNTEFQYLDGVTSNIQTQIDGIGGGVFDKHAFLTSEQTVTNSTTLATKLSLSYGAGETHYVEGEVMFDNEGAANCGAKVHLLFSSNVSAKFLTWQYTLTKTSFLDLSNNTFMGGLQTLSSNNAISKFGGRIIFRALFTTSSATNLNLQVAQNTLRADQTFYLRGGTHLLSRKVI